MSGMCAPARLTVAVLLPWLLLLPLLLPTPLDDRSLTTTIDESKELQIETDLREAFVKALEGMIAEDRVKYR